MILPSHIVVFDGECAFCNAWVRFVARRDTRGAFKFAPRQSEAGREVLSPFAVLPDDPGSIVLVLGNNLYAHSDAILLICRELGWPWSTFSLLRVIPRPIRDLAYTLVARNRYRLGGRQATCDLDPAVQSRLLR